MVTKRKKTSLPPSLALAVSVALALLPWGLPMIGVTINLPLGAAILAVAFVVMVYAFWRWEATSRWHKALRIGTVAVAALAYFSLVGYQINAQYWKDHTPTSVSASPPSQPPAVHAPIQSTPTDSSAQSALPPKSQSAKKTFPSQIPPSQIVISGGVSQHSEAECSPNVIGNGNTNNLNCGPPKYMSGVDPKSTETFVRLLGALHGKKIAIFINSSTKDSGEFGEFVARSTNAAGLLFDPGTPSGGNIPIFGANQFGLSVSYPDERADEAKVLIDAFHNSGVTTDPIPRVPGIGKPGILGLYICPKE